MSGLDNWPQREFKSTKRMKKHVSSESRTHVKNKSGSENSSKQINDKESSKGGFISRLGRSIRNVLYKEPVENGSPVSTESEEAAGQEEREAEFTIPKNTNRVTVTITKPNGSNRTYTITNYIAIDDGDILKVRAI